MVVNIFATLHSTFVLSDLKPIAVELVEVYSHQTHLDHMSWLFQLVSLLELFPVWSKCHLVKLVLLKSPIIMMVQPQSDINQMKKVSTKCQSTLTVLTLLDLHS